MPIYEFICKDCGREFEFLVCAADTEKPACRHCGGINISRLLSRFSARGAGPGSASGGGKSCSDCHTGRNCSTCS